MAVGAVSVGIGTQVFGSILRPSSFCGCFGFKPTVGAINRGGSHDALSQSTHGPLAASLADAWAVAYEISKRVGGDPGFPGLYGPATCPAPLKPRRLAVLETDGWAVATPAAKAAFEEASAKLKSAGVALVSRHDDEKIAAVEDAISGARELSHNIIAWESRWPLNTYRARDTSKLSQAMLDLAARGDALTLDDYRRDVKERDKRRAAYHALAGEFDACATLSAPGAAPAGLGWTGRRVVCHSGLDARRPGDLAARASGRWPAARASADRLRRRRRSAIRDRGRRHGRVAARLTGTRRLKRGS